jgi:hypothetical protein
VNLLHFFISNISRLKLIEVSSIKVR